MSRDPRVASRDPFAIPEISREETERLRAQDAKAAASAEVECSICLELVTSKARLGERRFGILSGCDHPFCLACIRDWRDGGTAREAGEATSSALEQARKCPVCRELSHFITPSTTWPSDAEEKRVIIAEYQTRMKKIPCRNFDYGDGHCPFGSSCFYRHVYRVGTEESHEVRKTTDSEGNLHIASGVRLSDFFDTAQGQRAFRNSRCYHRRQSRRGGEQGRDGGSAWHDRHVLLKKLGQCTSVCDMRTLAKSLHARVPASRLAKGAYAARKKIKAHRRGWARATSPQP